MTFPNNSNIDVDREQLIDRLICTCCTPSRHTELEQQTVRSRLVGYATRLAESAVATSSSGDPDAAFQAIRQRLLQQHRSEDAARFTELYQHLSIYGGLSNNGRFALLSLLQQLAEQGTNATASGIINYKPLQLPKALPLRSINSEQRSSYNQQETSKVQRPRAMQHGGVPAVPHQQQTTAGSDVSMVKQLELVSEVLKAVQCLTGHYCSFNPAAALAGNPAATGPAVVIAGHDKLKLQVGYRTLIHELGELGLMYRRVLAVYNNGRDFQQGSVRQALCTALHDEMADFYRLMAVLKEQLATPQPVPGSETPDSSGPYLTLRRLQLWLAEPMRRMRFLAVLVDGCQGRVGGDLAGRVWAASKVGDPLASSYATRLLHQICVPLFDMVRHWVFEGVLQDPAYEFFIVHSGNTSSNGDLWKNGYRKEPAKLPPFINTDLADIILRAGKSINFLRDACNDAEWVQEWAPGAAEAAAGLGYGQLPVLERVVSSAGRRVDARLMAVLQTSGELDRHCQAIRRYLLLGQGDFVVALLDCLGPELNKPARDVSEVTLNHLLRTALTASAGAAQEEGGVQDRLRATKAPAGEAETGWDVFSLQYQLGPPLNSIFTPDSQTKYSRLSRLIWLMRRTESSLGMAWQLLKVDIERGLPRFKNDPARQGLDDLLRSCLRLRAEMAHFNINMQYYINLEVLECAWSEFVSASAAAPDLDCLIAAHQKFLDTVLKRALLESGKAESLRRTLTQLLKTCMSLQPMVQRFNEKVQTGMITLERRAAETAENTAAGRWGTTQSSTEPVVAAEDINDLRQTWAVLADTFRRQLIEFLRALPAAADEVNAEVRFLMARLNFSDYYKQEAVATS